MSEPVASFRAGVVALVGRPNVGKSTLLNFLVGQKISIVSDKPQTTRNRIAGVVHGADHQLVLLDTPGIHRPLHRMNERMMEASLAALREVDLVAVLTDVTEGFGRGDAFVALTLKSVRVPVFLLVNKVDRIRRTAVLPVIAHWARQASFAEVYPISALSGEGVEEMKAGLIARLPAGPPLFPPDQVSDVSVRFLAGEIVREKILEQCRDEIPYTTTVVIESFEEGAGEHPLTRIEAVILVERDSQKGILVGRAGERVRAIGTAARTEIEEMLGARVYLELRVKAGGAWRDNERILARLGLG